jgi:hypothetical protein
VVCHKYFLKTGYWRIGDNASRGDQPPKLIFGCWQRAELVFRRATQPNTRYSADRAVVVEQHMVRLTIRRTTCKHIPGESVAHSKALMAAGYGRECRRRHALGQVELSCALFLLQPQRLGPRPEGRALARRRERQSDLSDIPMKLRHSQECQESSARRCLYETRWCECVSSGVTDPSLEREV